MMSLHFRLILARSIVVLASVAPFASPSIAATIVVDTLEDNQGAVDACSLRAAIINANNDDQSGSSNCPPGSGFDSITFDPELAGDSIEMNGTPLPTVSDSLTVQGPEVGNAAGLTIDARGLSRIIKLSDVEPATLVINSVTLTGGRTSVDGVQEGGGAALNAHALKLESPHVVVLNHVRLTANSTTGERAAGAAILAIHATLMLENTEVSNNWTEGETAHGGGLAVGTDSVVALFDSQITNNTVEGDFSMGGGIMGSTSRVEATDSDIIGNTTRGRRGLGGGILLDMGGLELTRSTLADNATQRPSSSGGGAMVLGTVILADSQVTGNETAGDSSLGGGLAVGLPPIPSISTQGVGAVLGLDEDAGRGDVPLNEVRLTVADSIVSGNSTAGAVSHGGGILVHEATGTFGGKEQQFPAHLELENSTVANNATSGEASQGGGIAVVNSTPEAGTATLRNATVSNNATVGIDSPSGGMVASLTHVSLLHATLAFNQSDAGVDGIRLIDADETDFEVVNSMIVQSGVQEVACSQAATATSNALATDTTCTGSASSTADIALEPLADHGGSTPTHAPAAFSIAINAAGDCVEQTGVTQDQRGQPRPGGQSITCDIGAYERQDTPSNDTVFADRFRAE